MICRNVGIRKDFILVMMIKIQFKFLKKNPFETIKETQGFLEDIAQAYFLITICLVENLFPCTVLTKIVETLI